MAKPVMVPLDGSEKDERALPVATSLARLADTGLHLMRVFELAEGSDPMDAAAIAGPVAEARDAVLGTMAGLADRLAADSGRQATWAVVAGANVAHQIVKHAREREAQFVVMATRAPSAAGRVIRGSVADHVMRESTRPVVLVPPGADFLRGKHIQVLRVLIPLDGSALAARSIDYLLALPNATALEYFLLEVVPPGDPRGQSQAERRLDAAAERMQAHGVRVVDVGVMEDPDPAQAIVAGVREALAEMIAMSTRGAGGVRRLALGSVAEGVVRSAEVPVMLLTPTELGFGEGD